MSLEELFTPRSLAVIGSMAPGKLGGVLLKQVIEGGFSGEVFAVNPKAQGAYSAAGFSSIAKIGQPVDLAILACPAAHVAGVLDDCGKSGVRSAVIITAGFSEIGNREGEYEISAIARRYAMRIIGPNCAGIINTHHHLFPTLQVRPPLGRTAVVTQSGAFGGLITAWAKELDLGISKFVSYGNGVDLGQAELIQYLGKDADTDVVALYIESIPDGHSFLEALSRCAQRKPVIIIKAGRTAAGNRATTCHTGSPAGSDRVFEAAVRSAGAVRVETLEEMLDLCRAFTTVKPPQGRRLAIITNSGGPAILTADAAEKLGLLVAEPSDGLKNELRKFLPPNCAVKNPIDLTVEGTGDGYQRVMAAVQGEFDAVVAMNVCPPHLEPLSLAQGVLAGIRECARPVLATFQPVGVVAQAVDFLHDHGIENFPSGERAVAAIAGMSRYAEMQAHGITKEYRVPDAETQNPPNLFGGRPAMPEPEAMTWLKKEGFPVQEYDRAHLLRNVREFVITISRDPQFGPVISLKYGGMFRDFSGDISLRIAPITRDEAREMIREMRGAPSLGDQVDDSADAGDVLVRLSHLPFRYPEISAIVLNPVTLSRLGWMIGGAQIHRLL